MASLNAFFFSELAGVKVSFKPRQISPKKNAYLIGVSMFGMCKLLWPYMTSTALVWGYLYNSREYKHGKFAKVRIACVCVCVNALLFCHDDNG
jgi:hypothetical protein